MTTEKLVFALEIDDGWPPISAEGVWCEKVDDNYKLLNTPFFIPDLACGDIFKAIPDPINQNIFEFDVIEESGNSVIWVMNNNDLDIQPFTETLQKIGCVFEGFPRYSLLSVDVPSTVDIVALEELLDLFEELGLDFAYPVWRFGE
ncbi:MAG: hypothetical protein ACI87J_000157 [Colwellia sp.]|uniref:DUF4265 domain-containing protein n=1 Tax=Colwellia sp. MB3u-55 TaxID=2759810 RepID=UPI0015F6BD65|nr:DUF4265 domain-containing protein [Colwellia sp. MB3u-55]MBA6250953.1 DUF4265 domain-containing protein [Colwellia sp. MB3u-55]